MTTKMSTTEELFGGTMMSPVPDPYPIYKKLRDGQPVIPLNTIMGVTHMVTRYADVAAILKDGKLFSSRGNARGIGLVMGRTILEMEGKEHVRHRSIVTPFFSPRAMKDEKMQSMISAVVHDLIDRFAAQGRADLVRQFTFTFPLRVISTIIGIPIEDFDAFHRMALDLISVGDDPPRGLAAAQSLLEYLQPILDRLRKEPKDDLFSKLVHAEVDGNRLSDEEILSFLRLLLPAGAETTYRLTGSCLYALLHFPEVWEEVSAERSKIDLLVEEILRWESPVQYVSREATERTELSGCEVPEKAMLSVVVGSANRDERHYDDPDRFDLHRSNADHLGFGFGEHFCAGSHLARLEVDIALNALLDRLPNLRLDRDRKSTIVGLAFRSPDHLPVLFDPRS
jgi:cytochrome P450